MGTLRDRPTNPAYAATNFATNLALLERLLDGPKREVAARRKHFERRTPADPFEREHMELLRTLDLGLQLLTRQVDRTRARGDLLKRHQQGRKVQPAGLVEQAPERDGSMDHGSSLAGDAA